ncbi:stimulus-sensing domain-containing protein [Fodinicurvata sp. EGI_FJ10296]|uniref:stimulus-sensing domain-containing protein n=1 Tax=Fodinicurvata sp. EGI_FJ10296 TaxID=3231908 RepID=UPI003454C223
MADGSAESRHAATTAEQETWRRRIGVFLRRRLNAGTGTPEDPSSTGVASTDRMGGRGRDAPTSAAGERPDDTAAGDDWAGPRDYPRRRLISVSKLTARVLAVNILALVILVSGILYLGQYEEELIQDELESLRTEAQIFAGLVAEGAIVDRLSDPAGLDPELGRQMVRRFYEATDTRTRLFDPDGTLIGDSRLLVGGGGLVEVEPLPEVGSDGWLRAAFDTLYGVVVGAFPERKRWPVYEELPFTDAAQYPPVQRALDGSLGQQVWSLDHGGQKVGVAVPVQQLRAVLGVVMLTRDTTRVDRTIQSLRENILKVFGVSLGVTILLSIYLAASITVPIRRLAAGADLVRRGHGRQQVIPDFTRRRDEIGELSGSLRDMTAALWARMDAIESFAADVSHEIKNPLSSLRSAVETTTRIQDPEKLKRLMTIIEEDVQRLDRLITDISNASRLDAELSRAEAEIVDMAELLDMLDGMYRETSEDVALDVRADQSVDLTVLGLRDRLVQVLRNLVANAVSFSPPDGRVVLRSWREDDMVVVTVTDDGPGIPEGKFETIFDRFYTERPAGEKFGTHSGLGLNISKQIVQAHHGRITARNRTDGIGAVFRVDIPAAR